MSDKNDLVDARYYGDENNGEFVVMPKDLKGILDGFENVTCGLSPANKKALLGISELNEKLFGIENQKGNE